mmetsp:Transcript_25342/g.53535  ORF Transcript_25342/g.53535 Transcript_25342/m.53535 type:complete len:318 (-) Transcript_25342:124-1077(-)
MDDNVNIIITSAEEVVSFDNLQSLIHHGSTIQRNLRPHIPIRMRRRLLLHSHRILLAHFKQFILRKIPKRSTTRRQNHPTQSTGRDTLQTLKDGTVLRIGREHIDAVLFHERIDDGSTGNEGFLVGEGDVLAKLNSLDGGEETGRADDAGDDSVSGTDSGGLDDTLVSVDDLRHVRAALLFQNRLKLFGRLGSGKGGHLWRVFHHLFGHEFGIVPRTECIHNVIFGTGIHDFERLGTDTSSGTEDGNSLLEGASLEGFGEGLLEGFCRVYWGGGIDPSFAGAFGSWSREYIERCGGTGGGRGGEGGGLVGEEEDAEG